MTTLENINNNILTKIKLIDKSINNFTIIENNNYNFNKNVGILKNKGTEYENTKILYNTQSILFLTEYYDLVNKSNNLFHNKQQNLNNVGIFNINNDSKINLDDLLELKKIYSDNYYTSKYFNPNIVNYSYNNTQAKLKKIYNNFNTFINVNGIYGIFDSYAKYVNDFVEIFEDFIKIINPKLNLYQSYKKTIISDKIKTISYDKCECGNKMIVQDSLSELLCLNCGFTYTLLGSVFSNEQFYSQERYQHALYNPMRHAMFWVARIQAIENTAIDKKVIDKINNNIKRDGIENIKGISVEQFRLYLKQNNLSKYNNHIPLIKKIITGYIPPQLTYKELHTIYNYFDKSIKTYEIIKPKEKSNTLYYPFILAKLIELVIDDVEKRKELISGIHMQSYNTLIENDKIWKKICNYKDNFKYIPTVKFSI